MLYLPVVETVPAQATSYYEDSPFSELDATQETLTYALPEPVVVVDCPDENESFMMMSDGDGQLGEGELPLTLRIGREVVPEGAILEWVEEVTETENRRVWWYVQRAIGYGTANVGSLYICIPARNIEGLPNDSI
ncbi:phage protein [Photobacterium aphoticum]|uniref:Phage protein n=1 Tax=Photobacterium aphoticum TaxID=754436 RepID=A0A090QYI0_9GAMM|nr:phage protein [Photobacterium aphoticum]